MLYYLIFISNWDIISSPLTNFSKRRFLWFYYILFIHNFIFVFFLSDISSGIIHFSCISILYFFLYFFINFYGLTCFSFTFISEFYFLKLYPFYTYLFVSLFFLSLKDMEPFFLWILKLKEHSVTMK